MFQKLYKHLEEINRNTTQAPSNALIQVEWAEKICQRLDVINNTLSTQKKHPLSGVLVISSIILSCLGLMIVVSLTLNSLQLSRANRKWTEGTGKMTRALFVANGNYQELSQKQQDAQVQARRMDSLVEQQSQTIKELKKLNEVTVRAFMRMKKEMDRQALRDVSGGNSILK